MKVKLGFLLACLLTLPSFASNFVKEVAQPISAAFVPHGFDADDSVEIMVMGVLKSSCSKIGQLTEDLDAEGKVLKIGLTTYEYTGKCIKTEVPFFLPVYVGLLRTPGRYTIQDYVSHRNIGVLDIAKVPGNGSGIDNAIYPLLTDAYVQKHSGRNYLVMKGILPLDCLAIQDVTVNVQPNVVVVLPRLGRVEGRACHAGNYPFTKVEALTKALPKGIFLLHARSMGGRSINKIETGN